MLANVYAGGRARFPTKVFMPYVLHRKIYMVLMIGDVLECQSESECLWAEELKMSTMRVIIAGGLCRIFEIIPARSLSAPHYAPLVSDSANVIVLHF